MNREEFLRWATGGDEWLTDRQGEAFYRRHVAGEGREEAAEAMDTSPSNVDNLERAARDKIRKSSNLMAVLSGVDYEYDGEIGTCAECDEPTRTLVPDPDDDSPLEDRRMLCESCAEAAE